MEFSHKEMQAILKIATAMIVADGRVDEKESIIMYKELKRFGIDRDDVDLLMIGFNELSFADVIRILSDFNEERKKYVSSLLGVIMASDGDINDKEMALWKNVSMLCDFPQMTIIEAMGNIATME